MIRPYIKPYFSPYRKPVQLGAKLKQTNEPEVTAYISGLTTPLSAGQITKLNTFVSSLKTGLSITALSDAFDVMYILGGETEESSLRNLVKNAHHASAVNSPAFTQYEGFTGNGTSMYINTNYNASTHADNYAQNSATVSYYSRSQSFSTGSPIGAANDTNGWTEIVGISNLYYIMINGGPANNTLSASYGQNGLTTLVRNSSSKIQPYKNKSKESEKNATSDKVFNTNMRLLYSWSQAQRYWSNQLSFFFASRGLTEDEVGKMVDTIEQYMDSNGKGVIS
jgi:hypothetical protein